VRSSKEQSCTLPPGQLWTRILKAGLGNWAGVTISKDDGSTLTAYKVVKSYSVGGIYSSKELSSHFYPLKSTALQGEWAGIAGSDELFWVVAVQRKDKFGGPGYILTTSDGQWYRADTAGQAYWSAVTCLTTTQRPLVCVHSSSKHG